MRTVLLLLASTALLAQSPPRIALAGDSTVTDASGWGLGFQDRLRNGAVCLNFAKSGRSSKSFVDEGHWAKVLEAKPSHVLIQFGHNDSPGKGPARETDPDGSFREWMNRYIDEARAAGIQPILLTSLTRRTFDKDGRLREDALPRYAAAMRIVAKAKGVKLIDLHPRSQRFVESLGQSESDKLGPVSKQSQPDRTHLNRDGARRFGAMVAWELAAVEPALASYIDAQ